MSDPRIWKWKDELCEFCGHKIGIVQYDGCCEGQDQKYANDCRNYVLEEKALKERYDRSLGVINPVTKAELEIV